MQGGFCEKIPEGASTASPCWDLTTLTAKNLFLIIAIQVNLLLRSEFTAGVLLPAERFLQVLLQEEVLEQDANWSWAAGFDKWYG